MIEKEVVPRSAYVVGVKVKVPPYTVIQEGAPDKEIVTSWPSGSEKVGKTSGNVSLMYILPREDATLAENVGALFVTVIVRVYESVLDR